MPDAMYETLEATNHTLTQVVDVINNVKTEVKSIQPLMKAVDNIRTEVSSLKREIKRIDEKGKLPAACKTCGKKIIPGLQTLSILRRNSYCFQKKLLLPELTGRTPNEVQREAINEPTIALSFWHAWL